jgi:phosphoribosylanthranilate isomerase
MGLLVKVCGLRDPENIRDLLALPNTIRPALCGFILYEKSSRYAGHHLSDTMLEEITSHGVKPIAVTVNMPMDTLLTWLEQYPFAGVQLHGQESVEYIRQIQLHLPDMCMMKAIPFPLQGYSRSMIEPLIEQCELYAEICSYILADTASTQHGGTGTKFDWRMLAELPVSVQKKLILAGGIGEDDSSALHAIASSIAGIDINSRFEHVPGYKDISRISHFLEQLADSPLLHSSFETTL